MGSVLLYGWNWQNCIRLKKLMIENGIKIKTNTEAKEFIIENNHIKKIITNNEDLTNIDLVVCMRPTNGLFLNF